MEGMLSMGYERGFKCTFQSLIHIHFFAIHGY